MALPGQYQQQDFDKDTLFREKYGTHASGKDRRTFNRYWNSSQREADELAHVQGEIAKSNAYWDNVTQGAINRMRGVPTPAPAPAAPSLYQTQDFEQAKMAEMYGTDPSKRDQRRFRRYINSEEGQQEWLAHDAAEHQKYLGSMDAIVAHRKAQMQNTADNFAATVKPALVPKAAPEVPATPPPAAPVKPAVKPAVTPRSDAEWNRIAKENGFTDMAEVKAWQAANGLTADGKFGNTSSAFFKQNNLGKYVRPGSEVVEKPVAPEVPVETPPQQVGFNLESYITDNGLNSKYFDGKRYARVDPNGAGDFWVDDTGKIFESTLGGGLGKEISKSSTLQYNSPYYWDTKRGKAYSSLRSGLANAGATLHKQGGTMNRINYFQQGGAAPQQDIKAQVTALVQAAMQGDQKATQQVNQIMEAAKAGDQQAMQIAQIMEQVVKELQGQAVAAKYGAKLDYLQTLKCGGKAKAKKKEQGGKVCPACEQAKQIKKPLITKHQSGGAVGFYRNWTPDEIRKLQNKLAAYGYYEGDLDGIVGSQTINAVKKFQTEHGVAADGMWGKNTNSQKQFVDWETADKGGRKSTWKTEQGSLVALPTNFTYTKLSDLSNKDAQAVIDYYSAYPELLYSDDPEHAKWRQVFHNSGQAGADFLNQSFGAMSVADRATVDPKKTTTSHKTAELQSDMAEGNTRAAAQLLPVLASPFAIGGVTSVLAGSAGLAGYTGLAGSMIGAPIGGNVGAKRGRKRGEKKQDELYHDEVAERYGAASAVHDPKRRIAEEEAKGRNVGTLVGGLAGGVGGSITGAGAEAGYYSLLGQGRANLGYAGTPATAQPSVGMYGTTTPPPVQGVSNMQMLKAGLKPANLSAGRTRLGGTYGIRFNHNGKFYNAGTPASQEVINAANTYYNNPMSPLRVNFGGTTNTGAGAKLGLAYGVNVPAAAGIGAQVAPMGIIVDDAISDTQPNHPVRQQKRADRKEERKEKRQERHKKLVARTAESTTD